MISKVKISLTVLFFYLYTLPSLAQSGGIEGYVLNELGNPVELASVQLGSSRLITSTDSNGYFAFVGVSEGDYQIQVFMVGFKRHTQSINIRKAQNEIVRIILEEDRLHLEEVVVSGTRYDLSRKESPVIVNVISPAILDANQSVAISDGLNFQPGVRVETNCQNCGFTQVRLNGLGGAYSQILINNRAVFSALNGVYGLEQIPANIVERVEVVRSGGSALYGSNAIAGTVNIITRDPLFNAWRLGTNTALIDGQSLDQTLNYNGSIVSDDLKTGVTLFGMNRNRQSYDANGDGFTELTELRTNVMGAKAFVRTGDLSRLTIDFSGIREYRRGGDRLNLAPHFTDISEQLDHNTMFYGVTYDQFLDNSRMNKLSTYVSGQLTERDSYYGGLGGGRTSQDSILARNAYGKTDDFNIVSGIQYTRQFRSGDVLVAGLESQFSDVRDQFIGYNRLVDQQVNNIGLYAQFEKRIINKLKLLAGARFDYSDVQGRYSIEDIQRNSNADFSVFSPRITALYDISPELQLRGGYARGFRAPQAFNEDLHISSVGGEPQFVILSEDLEKEISDALTTSVNYSNTFGFTQINALVEGFYTRLNNPFTIVSTGASLANGSILEEQQNGVGATVSGINFEVSASPSSRLLFQLGGTAQQAVYDEAQVLYEPENPETDEEIVSVNEFTRTPNLYGYFLTSWRPIEAFSADLSGTYTGSMIVPRVINENGFPDLRETEHFYDINIRLAWHFDVHKDIIFEIAGGVRNVFNSYQDDFDIGATRDSDYVYGPAQPRTYFISLRLGNYH
jgi:outer membrane receptor for ferrienterochelin and colicins